MNPLTQGAYPIAPDCTAFVRGGKVIVSRKKQVIDETPRCRNCKHYGQGRNTYGHHDQSHVCFMRPKTNGLTNGYPREVQQQQRYYATQPAYRACDKYEPKDTPANE